ncbi:response regulator transcription factor [Burkholderia sp. BCC1977]|uniref:response regulator transcription factor n=1 Tax=Burkholderia sp. BCC1977 TaxID=2817440 RepID=UPI002ABD939C|nr:response regulator transcription factor [Burkholderia sp. BCC1977]
MKILILDNRESYGDLLNSLLQHHGNEVTLVKDNAYAVRTLQQSMFDLIILDLIKSAISGLDILRWIRNNFGYRVPVLTLSNGLADYSTTDALNAGADDCIRMPVSKSEFIARVNAIARRANIPSESDTSISIGDYMVPRGGRNIFIKGEPIKVTRKEFDIIATLFRNIECVVPREYLIAHVWGKDRDTTSRSLDTHIYRAKTKLGLNGAHGLSLQSIYTVGYRLERVRK